MTEKFCTLTENILAYAKTWGDVGASVVSAVVSFALISAVWFTVAPIFGLSFSGNSLGLSHSSSLQCFLMLGPQLM